VKYNLLFIFQSGFSGDSVQQMQQRLGQKIIYFLVLLNPSVALETIKYCLFILDAVDITVAASDFGGTWYSG